MNLTFLNRKFASIASVFLLANMIVFHILVLTEIIPFDLIWGGRLQSKSDMIVFESLSIGISLFIILIIMSREEWLRLFNPKVALIGIWVVFGFFTLNTIGNLLAAEALERVLFTPLTFLMAVFTLRLAAKK
jgi:hypothetical protein